MLNFLVPDAMAAAEEAATQTVNTTSVFGHILDADPIVQFTLLLLIGFSIACWALIFYKGSQLRAAQKSSQYFWQKFSATPSLEDILNSKMLKQGPLFHIFSSGKEAFERIQSNSKGKKAKEHQRDFIAQRINQSKEEEIYKLEQYVGFLATTASAAPFIGLFGTVWGILMAFMKIGQEGSTSLATVGPYISEALVATAVGLFAAIPAVIAYNYFVGKIRIISKIIDLFIDDFTLKAEQELA